MRWCSEPHLPGKLGEAHFDCDLCSRTGHVRNAVIDLLGRRVNVTHPGCVDDISPVDARVFFDREWPFQAHSDDAAVTATNPQPWLREGSTD